MAEFDNDKRREGDDRLARIESKLDKMSEAIVALARVEVKIGELDARRQEGHDRVNRMSQKIDQIEVSMTSMGERMNIMTKIIWVIGVGSISAILSYIQTNILTGTGVQ